MIQNGAKFIQKLTPGFKNHMRNFGQLQTTNEKSKKQKLGGLLLTKKYIPSVKTLYTEDLTFNYLCEDIQNYLCHYIIFHNTTTLQLFSSNTPYFVLSTKVAQIFRLSITWVKIHQILMSFLSQIFLKVWISFHCHERKFFCNILVETLCTIDKNSTLKCKF